jgi:hypothetical protein
MKKYIVTLTEEERKMLGELTSKGEHKRNLSMKMRHLRKEFSVVIDH